MRCKIFSGQVTGAQQLQGDINQYLEQYGEVDGLIQRVDLQIAPTNPPTVVVIFWYDENLLPPR